MNAGDAAAIAQLGIRLRMMLRKLLLGVQRK
jgi:hypothetical protein